MEHLVDWLSVNAKARGLVVGVPVQDTEPQKPQPLRLQNPVYSGCWSPGAKLGRVASRRASGIKPVRQL